MTEQTHSGHDWFEIYLETEKVKDSGRQILLREDGDQSNIRVPTQPHLGT
jgi:hypothetical protein